MKTGLFVAFLALCAPVAAQTAAPKPAWNVEGKTPFLLAHYMPWFGGASRKWAMWIWKGSGTTHDATKRRKDGLRDLAAAYYPLIGPYDSRSRAVMRYHLQTAKNAGISAFGCIWYGPNSETDRAIAPLLDEAARVGMKITLCYEEKINFAPYRTLASRDELVSHVTADLKYVLEKYGSHPAFLKRGGVPFVYQFNNWGTDELGPRYLTSSEWKKVFAALPPVVYARQNLNDSYHPTIGGAYLWWTPDPAQISAFANHAAQLRAAGKLDFFMSMASPGFDDSGVSGWGAESRVTPRAGLSVWKDTFDHALGWQPDCVQIVTWNDFSEGTVVEPTRENGFQYLDALETWWGEATGRPVNLQDNRAPFLEFQKTCAPAERAELPQNPAPLLASRSLQVAMPNYLTVLARKNAQKSVK